jgi:hypothetical protein
MVSESPAQELTLLIPAENGWELWDAGPTATTLREQFLVDEGRNSADATAGKIWALPMSTAYAVPLWIPSTEPDVIQGAVDIQLEKLNLRPENQGGQLLTTEKIDTTPEGQTLVLSSVLHEKSLPQLPRAIPEQCELSAALYDLPEDALVIWKELGKLVVVVTRGDKIAHFQTLTSSQLTANTVHEIDLMLMQIEAQQIPGEIQRVILWTEAVDPGADQLLGQTLRLPVQHSARPKPERPPLASGLLPPAIAQARLDARRRARLRKIIMLVSGLYLAALAGLVFYCLKEVKTASDLAKQKKALDQETGWVEGAQSQWKMLLDVSHADRFALNRFYEVVKNLNENSKVRLTKFVYEPTKLIISGEAQDTTKAITYQNALARDTALSDYAWDKNPPQGQRNGTCTFQITGTLKNAIPVSQ